MGLIATRRSDGFCLVEVGNYYGVYLTTSLTEVNKSTPLSVCGFSKGDRVKLYEEAKKTHTNGYGALDDGGCLSKYNREVEGEVEIKWSNFPTDGADGKVYDINMFVRVGDEREMYYGHDLVKL